jgi:hypothetical protein
MSNAFSRLVTCLAVVVAVGSLWRIAIGDPQPPIRIGDGPAKSNGRPEMLMPAKVDLLVSRMEKLEAENQALKKQVAQLESGVQKNTGDLGVTKLLLAGLDKSVLDKDYRNHTHEMGFGFSNPATVTNSKSNILIPWISSGQLKSGSNFRTGTPQ